MVKPASCAACPLYRVSTGFVPDAHIKQPRLLIQGEAPGRDEVDEGLPFVGKAGWWLWKNILEHCGVTRDECSIGNTLRCLPPMNRQGEHYPIGKQRVEAEQCCRQYDRWSEYDKAIPLLLFGGKALNQHLGDESISKWHGHIWQDQGRLKGCTFHPAAIMRQPNLLPVAIREVTNVLSVADSGSMAVLERPLVHKFADTSCFDGPSTVVDFEWDVSQNNKVIVAGTATSDKEAYATFNVESVIDNLRAYNGAIVGHNVIDADFPVIGYIPDSFVPDRVFDTKVVAHLIHAHLAELGLLSLGSLVRMYAPTTDWKQDKADILTYNGYDCAYNWRLYESLKSDLTDTKQWHLVEKQQRLAHMAVQMRGRGIAVSSTAIRRFDEEWHSRRLQLASTFPFNPNSPKQVKEWAKAVGIPLADTTAASVSRAAGASGNDILKRLEEYKDEGKPITTWFDEQARQTGYIYPTFNVCGTAVARFSCAEPNCQNIPPYLRHIIIPRNSDLELVSFDFSNIENRTAAWLAGDMDVLQLWAQGHDPYISTASLMFGVPYRDVTDLQRKEAKVTELATLYGETAYNLAVRLYGDRKRESVSKAQKLQYDYFKGRPNIKAWQLAITKQMDSGDITLRNPFGRVRYIYAQDSHNRMKRACHYLGCSTAADIVNRKALDINKELGLLPLLIVHDEICLELPKGEQGMILRGRIAEILNEPVKELHGLVLPHKVKHGNDYGSLHNGD